MPAWDITPTTKVTNGQPKSRCSPPTEAAYLGHHFDLAAHAHASRRIGTENIFGDAAAAVYPQIGQINTFYDNRFNLTVAGQWHHTWQNSRYFVAVLPEVAYAHRNTIYTTQPTVEQLNTITATVALRGARPIGRLLTHARLSFADVMPTHDRLLLPQTKDELRTLAALTANRHRMAARNHTHYCAELAAELPLNNRYAISANVSYRYGHYTDSLNTHLLNVVLAFVF